MLNNGGLGHESAAMTLTSTPTCLTRIVVKSSRGALTEPRRYAKFRAGTGRLSRRDGGSRTRHAFGYEPRPGTARIAAMCPHANPGRASDEGALREVTGCVAVWRWGLDQPPDRPSMIALVECSRCARTTRSGSRSAAST